MHGFGREKYRLLPIFIASDWRTVATFVLSALGNAGNVALGGNVVISTLLSLSRLVPSPTQVPSRIEASLVHNSEKENILQTEHILRHSSDFGVHGEMVCTKCASLCTSVRHPCPIKASSVYAK